MEKMPALKSVAIGIWVNVGARDEGVGQQGISHFLEHMMFKGTKRRSSAQISHEIDALGGEMNAYTTHESTTFYIKVLDQQISQAVDLLADLFHHSRFSPKEIEKEKQVVLEEIRTVRDDPEDLVQELHAKDVLRKHPLGRPILGEQATMESLSRHDLLQYVREHYHPQKVVLAVAGNFNSRDLTHLLDKTFSSWTRNGNGDCSGTEQPTRRPPTLHGGLFVHPRRLEQTHMCFGFKGISLNDNDRFAAHILNTILGGGVSSRLFQEIREKRGLAYTIYSQLSSFSDGGTLTIYAATGQKEAAQLVDFVQKEIRKLRKNGMAPRELERTKTQMKGTLMLGLEGTYGRMSKLARDEMSQGRHVSLGEMVSEIDRVTMDQVLRLSRDLLDLKPMAITALGPVSQRTFLN